MASVARVPGSFRDPSGFVFSRQGVVHRQIAPSYALQYERLISSGLYDELVREEVGELRFVLQQMGAREAFVDFSAHQPGRVVRVGRPDRRREGPPRRVARVGRCVARLPVAGVISLALDP